MLTPKTEKWLKYSFKFGLVLGLIGIFLCFFAVFVFENLQKVQIVKPILRICLVAGIYSIFGMWIYGKIENYSKNQSRYDDRNN